MSTYDPTDWIEDVTALSPANLNHMEGGIASAHTEVHAASGIVSGHIAASAGVHGMPFGSAQIAPASVYRGHLAEKLGSGQVSPASIWAGHLAEAIGGSVADDSVTEEKISTALAEKLGVTEISTSRRGFASVATEQTTTATAPDNLATVGPSVTVVTPADALVAVFFAVEMKIGTGGSTAYLVLADSLDFAGGLDVANTQSTSYVLKMPTTTTAIANAGSGSGWFGGFLVFPASAGTHIYKLMYYKASPGTASYKNRKLWVLTIGF